MQARVGRWSIGTIGRWGNGTLGHWVLGHWGIGASDRGTVGVGDVMFFRCVRLSDRQWASGHWGSRAVEKYKKSKRRRGVGSGQEGGAGGLHRRDFFPGDLGGAVEGLGLGLVQPREPACRGPAGGSWVFVCKWCIRGRPLSTLTAAAAWTGAAAAAAAVAWAVVAPTVVALVETPAYNRGRVRPQLPYLPAPAPPQKHRQTHPRGHAKCRQDITPSFWRIPS